MPPTARCPHASLKLSCLPQLPTVFLLYRSSFRVISTAIPLSRVRATHKWPRRLRARNPNTEFASILSVLQVVSPNQSSMTHPPFVNPQCSCTPYPYRLSLVPMPHNPPMSRCTSVSSNVSHFNHVFLGNYRLHLIAIMKTFLYKN